MAKTIISFSLDDEIIDWIDKEGNPQHLITSSMENEDFMGFPAIALSSENKRKYLKKMPEDMKLELQGHVQSWLGMIKES